MYPEVMVARDRSMPTRLPRSRLMKTDAGNLGGRQDRAERAELIVLKPNDLNEWPLRADTVEKVFSGWRTKFSRAADAFRPQRCEGPRRFSEKRPRILVLAPCSIPAAELSKNQHLRDFWRRSIFDFSNSIRQQRSSAEQKTLILSNAETRQMTPRVGVHTLRSRCRLPPGRIIRGQRRGEVVCLDKRIAHRDRVTRCIGNAHRRVGANNKGGIAKQCNAFDRYSFPVTLLSCRASRANNDRPPLIVFRPPWNSGEERNRPRQSRTQDCPDR